MSKFNRHPQTQERDPKRAVGFAATIVLPGEDQDEFDSLLDDLRFQYEPEGPAEEDAVQTMADAIWRKRHLDVFQRAFEARMKWETYFRYPGDPQGFRKIIQEDRQRIVECTTLFATKLVEKELGKTGADSMEETRETAQLAKCKEVGANETNDNMTSNALPEGPFKRIVENATAAISAKNAEKTSDGARRARDMSDIVSEVVKKEFGTENAKAESEKPLSIHEQTGKVLDAFTKLLAAVEPTFGQAVVEDIWEQIYGTSVEHSLAKFGDLLTPECYMAELRLIELIDLTIERTHDRLMKFQASRARKAAANVHSLQPGWAVRHR
jgi:hypothetical protein